MLDVMSDKIDPSKVTSLNYPLGDIADTGAKIHPFKVHTGKQIYDSKNNCRDFGKRSGISNDHKEHMVFANAWQKCLGRTNTGDGGWLSAFL